MSKEYNGWANHATWNVALWIQNDEGLYNFAKEFKRRGYYEFVEAIKEIGGSIALQTPDGVAWSDDALDVEALDEMLAEL